MWKNQPGKRAALAICKESGQTKSLENGFEFIAIVKDLTASLQHNIKVVLRLQIIGFNLRPFFWYFGLPI